MKILKYKNIKILKKIFFGFIFCYFFFITTNINARINPYTVPSSCNKDSQCVSTHGAGTCCMADIYSNESLFNYFSCISTSSNPTSCPMYTGVVSNKCWPADVCLNGLDYAISGVAPINGKCGPAVGLTGIPNDPAYLKKLKNENQYCFSGVLSSDPKLNIVTKTWSWVCNGENNGTNVSCVAKYEQVSKPQINGVCYTYSVPLSSAPTQLCVSGNAGQVVLNNNVFSWVCSGKDGGASVSCNANAKVVNIVAIPETNPFLELANDPITKPSSNNQNVQTEIVSSYPNLEQKPANVLSYNLLEKYASPCSIKFDSECEVLDQSLLDIIKSKVSIQDAIDSGKLNGNLKVARMDYSVTPPKELDNYKTGLTLTNIQKLRKARVFPVGLELAALCITGQIPCSDGYIYDVVSYGSAYRDSSGNGCIDLGNGIYECSQNKNHKLRSSMGDVTLKDILAGYSVCDPLSSSYGSKNNKFCHLVNPNWILKDPKYMCESGTKNGPLLYVTDKQSQSNIRYETCPDVSTCLVEKDNEDCKAYGYCLREKNIWRFDLSADACSNQNVGCSQFSYTMGGKNTSLGFISTTTDTSICDTSNNGCRKYSLVKTGSSPSDWSYSSSDKIFLNSKISVCDSSSEGCTAFIRRDSANLIKNSSFEEYKLSLDFSSKQASFWNPYIGNKFCSDNITPCNTDDDCSASNGICNVSNGYNIVKLETTNNNVPVYNGSNSLIIQRYMEANAESYASYSLNKDYFIDVQPNKTYTLSYYVLGYNFSFDTNDLAKYSRGAFVNVKEYDKNKDLIPKNICSTGSSFERLGSLCDVNNVGVNCICDSSNEDNIIDVEALRYANTFLSSTWTRKTVSFKTGLDTYYLDIIPVLSKIRSNDNQKLATVVFDAIQLQEGSVATEYSLYEDSKVNYLKKAPEYSNCYSSSSDKDQIFCNNFIKSCDQKDVGCRKYQKKDDEDYWLPGKPNEDNYCVSECKGYQLYKEAGPSYNPINGSSFQSLIATTAKECSSADAGCSKYVNLFSKNTEYFSSIRSCVKQNDDIGVCESDNVGKICFNDSDCGSGTCKKSTAQYVDYFTYTGSETSGYKLNIYRLLRTKVCSNNKTNKCFNDSDCVGNAVCGYYDDVYAPALESSDSFDVCDETNYKKADHNPDCREFHGPKNKQSASGGSDGDYILYYANMSDVIFVSDENCSYDSIVPYQGNVSQSECNKISYLSPSIRYQPTTNTCNIGIYIPESSVCSESVLNCREYSGTSIASETLFSDSFENDNAGWKLNSGNDVNISTESIFINEHSVKVAYNETIKKIVVPEIINPEEKALYKFRLYAKNDSADGSLSNIKLNVGNTFSNTKQISNDWRLISFDIFSSSDLIGENSGYVSLVNEGLVSSGNKNVNLFVDYISVEKSASVYVIKDTWKTPISCDNTIDNPTGNCNKKYQELGFCSMEPNKVCLTGDNIGANCISSSNCSSDGTNKGDLCDYPNKVCRWGDNKNSVCNNDDDCYNDPASNSNTYVKTGSCSYTTNGYRLELGKMIGCDEYVDSYGNDDFYVFNDLNLCSADKMGCEAVYDTKNSRSHQKQQFNGEVDYSGVVSYYTFDDKNYISRNDYSSLNMKNENNVFYVKDGVSFGAALFDGTNNISEPINDNLRKAESNLSIYSWIRPNSFGGNIVSLDGSYSLSISNSGQIVCNIKGISKLEDGSEANINKELNSGNYKIALNKWQNVLCSYDGDRIKIYVNGEFVNSSDDIVFRVSYSNNSILKIGGGFVGAIDDFRIYNKFFDSKMAFDSYNDYNDNYYVEADELGYYIIDNKYSCDSKYKGCVALGRNEDRYDDSNFSYSTVFLVLDPDKFVSSGNFSTTGVYDGSMCKIQEEGCYSFKDSKNSIVNFKFPKNVCVYRNNVDVGVRDSVSGNAQLQNGWFKYDNKTKSISDVGCYLEDTIDKYSKSNINNKDPKLDPNSYKIVNSSDCEYRKDPVVVRRTFHGSCSYNSTIACNNDNDCSNYNAGSCNMSRQITRPKQTTYYVYKGVCSDNSGINCYQNSMCSSGYCVLDRTNLKCSADSGNPYCKPYGYDENPGIIDQFSNKSFEFNVCQSGSKVGYYCSSNNDCGINNVCGAPWTVVGWFKKNSTQGCSDDGDKDIEYTDYLRDYNESVGICNEYGCTNFIEPTEKRCVSGNLNGYICSSDNDCGASGVCVVDELNGSKYCKAKTCNNDNDCAFNDKCDVNKHLCAAVTKLNQSCVFDGDCGFGGICKGSNVYSYVKNDKINSSGCNGKVSRESGCVLFNDTSDTQLKFSSKLTYSGVKNGIAVAAVTGDNSGGDSQKDSNLIIKVKRDRECAEWLTFDVKGSVTKQDYDVTSENTGQMFPTCKKLSDDNRCLDTTYQGSGWKDSLNVGYYISQMKGDWFDEDFSGFAIPTKASINRNIGDSSNPDYWWKDRAIGSNAILSSNAGSANNVICKSYPERDSPFNFIDRFQYEMCSQGSDGLELNSAGDIKCAKYKNEEYFSMQGEYLTYDQFKSLTPKDYFKSTNGSITIPYDNGDGKAYYRIDNNQECYYEKVYYKDYLSPREQYFGKNSEYSIPQSVCYSSTNPNFVNSSTFTCSITGISIESRIANYTDSSLKYKGYCAEYDYSKELYYTGSGKYNCLTWIPGFVNEKK